MGATSFGVAVPLPHLQTELPALLHVPLAQTEQKALSLDEYVPFSHEVHRLAPELL